MRNDSDSIDDECWKLVWAASVQQRIRAFLWIAFHDRILGNLVQYKRHMTDDPKCLICGTTEESTIHILHECPIAKVVWCKLGDLLKKIAST